jgi:AcrR family transcriptional regulator
LFTFFEKPLPHNEKPRKSDLARDRILDAARRIFADDGYERATIRAIAAEASINPSMVIRYYGSKEGLFAAVAKLDFKIAALAGVPVAQLGETLVRHALDQWDHPTNGAALAAMMRASISNEAARERIVAQFSEQIAGLFAAIGPAAMAAAPFVATQMLGLAIARYIWRIPLVAALPRDVVVKQIGKAVQRYLDDAAQQQGE